MSTHIIILCFRGTIRKKYFHGEIKKNISSGGTLHEMSTIFSEKMRKYDQINIY